MKMQFEKNAGIALMLFSFLIIFTMVLHPAGGNFEHLLKITNMVLISHSLALISIPFAAVGFWGLTKKLGTAIFLSIAGFSIVVFGLVAVMMAGTSNGIVLPLFVQRYSDASPVIIESIKPILKYNSTVNMAFDYVYTAGFCLAMLCWSTAIIQTRRLPLWLAYAGLLISIACIVIFFLAGFSPAKVAGFRLFAFGIIIWTLAVGIVLARGNANDEPGH